MSFEKKQSSLKSTYSRPDLLTVNDKDDKYTYRWIHPKDTLSFVNGQDYRGWEIVRFGSKGTEQNEALTGLLSQFSKGALDTTIRTGDLVLARMPKAKAQERNDMYMQMHRDRVKALKDPKHKLSREELKDFTGKVDSWDERHL